MENVKSENVVIVKKVNFNCIDGIIRHPYSGEYIDLKECLPKVLATVEVGEYEVNIAEIEGDYYLITPGAMPYSAFPAKFGDEHYLTNFGSDFYCWNVLGARLYFLREDWLLAFCYHTKNWALFRRFKDFVASENIADSMTLND